MRRRMMIRQLSLSVSFMFLPVSGSLYDHLSPVPLAVSFAVPYTPRSVRLYLWMYLSLCSGFPPDASLCLSVGVYLSVS